MTALEQRAAISLAGIFCLRMLGLFMILPVFALYAEDLDGVTPLLIGLAIGAYGLTQAFLQVPFGMLSDRIGRKPVIIGGLILFAVGSVVAAMADDIWGIIIGRLIQGSGAIAAAVMAMAADLTRESQRTRAMAIIGLSIGFAFAVALVLGPVLNEWIGVPGIFWLTAILAIGGIGVVLFIVPNPVVTTVHRDAEPVAGQFGRVLKNQELLRLDFGILSLHMVLTSVFLALPLAFRDLDFQVESHWMVYLPVMIVAMAIMIPFVVVAEKRQGMKQVFVGAIAALVVSLIGFSFFENSLAGLVVALLVFFTAFNVLEATLPSLISKVAPPDAKGTAMGVYSSSQFIGAFFGGVLGGLMQHNFGLQGVFLFGALVLLVWLFVAYGMKTPRSWSNQLLRIGSMTEEEGQLLVPRLCSISGVEKAVIMADEGVAYLRVNLGELDRDALREFSVED